MRLRMTAGSNRTGRTSAVATLCAALFLFNPGCGDSEAPAPTDVVRPVRYVEVLAGGSGRVRTFSGLSRAGLESRLSFKVAGTVDNIAVSVGDNVQAGQLLARLDEGDLRLQKEEAEAALRSQQARSRNAQADYERLRGLYENGHAAIGDLDAARANSETATASVRSAEKAVELARRQLGYARLTAPVEGSIASVLSEENENVQAGQTVCILTSGDLPEVEVSVSESLIFLIRVGTEVRVRFDAVPNRTFNAVVTEVGVSPTGASTTFPVTVRLREAESNVRPGMAAEVDISFQAPGGENRIVVPAVAVGEDRRGRFVFVVRDVQSEEGVARRVTVETGDLDSDGLEIVTGLSDGDILVTAGVHHLEDGQRVRVPGLAGETDS